MELDEIADILLSNKRVCDDEVQNKIHPSIAFRYNSVSLLIGARGVGKTYWLSRELIKLSYAPGNRFTQVYYISDKAHDDTFEYAQKCINKNVEVVWVKTENALKLIETLTVAKGKLCDKAWCEKNPDDALLYRRSLNAEGSNGGSCIPHTLIVFDDSIGLFNKQTALAKKLFENRQSRITYIIALQDVQGISASMKANIDCAVIWGGFPKHKWNILTYQLPNVDGMDWETYSELGKGDYMFVDFIGSTVQIHYRE